MKLNKMISFGFASAIALCAATGADAREINQTKIKNTAGWDARVALTGGYGSSDMKFNRDPGSPATPSNPLEVRFKHVEKYEIHPELNMSWNSGFYGEARTKMSFITDGQSRYQNFNSGNGAGLTAGTGSLDGEWGGMASFALGYNLMALGDEEWSFVSVKPLVGWEYHKEKFSLRNMTTFANPGNGDAIAPNTSTAHQWKGPWAGLGLGFNLTPKHAIGGRGRYVWADYRGTLGTVVAKASKARGLGFSGEYAYQINPATQFTAIFDYASFRTKKSTIDESFPLGDPTLANQPSGDITWQTWSAHAGVTYRFW